MSALSDISIPLARCAARESRSVSPSLLQLSLAYGMMQDVNKLRSPVMRLTFHKCARKMLQCQKQLQRIEREYML